MLVLRKSYQEFSAGTPLESMGINVPEDLIVKRRNKIVMRPHNTTSRERRRDRRLAQAGM